jgi:hypothetical protein
MGTLHGLFVLDAEEWADWQKLVESKHSVYFGEVLGKHSEVMGPIEEGDFTVVTEDQEFCSKFVEYGCANGHNPFDYLEEDEGWLEIKNPEEDEEE